MSTSEDPPRHQRQDHHECGDDDDDVGTALDPTAEGVESHGPTLPGCELHERGDAVLGMLVGMVPVGRDELEAGLARVLASPADRGVVELLVARPEPGARVELAQAVLDPELGGANLPPGTSLAAGGAVVEVTEQPDTGCAKFAERFGRDAARFVNSAVGRAHNFRGINARVVSAGVVHPGDAVRKAPGADVLIDGRR